MGRVGHARRIAFNETRRYRAAGVLLEESPHGAYPLDCGNKLTRATLIPAVECAQFYRIRVLVVDGRVLARIFSEHQ